MKLIFGLIILGMNTMALADSLCDIRLGNSVGVQVVEFATGNVVHSKMPLKEISQSALTEEMISLQDMEICAEKIITKKCVLKFEKKFNTSRLTLFRGSDKWLTWQSRSKPQAEEFVRKLQGAGFCS